MEPSVSVMSSPAVPDNVDASVRPVLTEHSGISVAAAAGGVLPAQSTPTSAANNNNNNSRNGKAQQPQLSVDTRNAAETDTPPKRVTARATSRAAKQARARAAAAERAENTNECAWFCSSCWQLTPSASAQAAGRRLQAARLADGSSPATPPGWVPSPSSSSSAASSSEESTDIGLLLSCEGGCLRSFHPICMGVTPYEVEVMAGSGEAFLCKECKEGDGLLNGDAGYGAIPAGHACGLCRGVGHRVYAPLWLYGGGGGGKADTTGAPELLDLFEAESGGAGCGTPPPPPPLLRGWGASTPQSSLGGGGGQAVGMVAPQGVHTGTTMEQAGGGIPPSPLACAALCLGAARVLPAVTASAAHVQALAVVQGGGGGGGRSSAAVAVPASASVPRQSRGAPPNPNPTPELEAMLAALQQHSLLEAERVSVQAKVDACEATGESAVDDPPPTLYSPPLQAGAPSCLVGTYYRGVRPCTHRLCGLWFHYACLRRLSDLAVARVYHLAALGRGEEPAVHVPVSVGDGGRRDGPTPTPHERRLGQGGCPWPPAWVPPAVSAHVLRPLDADCPDPGMPFLAGLVGSEACWLAPGVSPDFLCPRHACDTCELGMGGAAQVVGSVGYRGWNAAEGARRGVVGGGHGKDLPPPPPLPVCVAETGVLSLSRLPLPQPPWRQALVSVLQALSSPIPSPTHTHLRTLLCSSPSLGLHPHALDCLLQPRGTGLGAHTAAGSVDAGQGGEGGAPGGGTRAASRRSAPPLAGLDLGVFSGPPLPPSYTWSPSLSVLHLVEGGACTDRPALWRGSEEGGEGEALAPGVGKGRAKGSVYSQYDVAWFGMQLEYLQAGVGAGVGIALPPHPPTLSLPSPSWPEALVLAAIRPDLQRVATRLLPVPVLPATQGETSPPFLVAPRQHALIVARDRLALVRRMMARRPARGGCIRCVRWMHSREGGGGPGAGGAALAGNADRPCMPPGAASNHYAVLCPVHSHTPLPGEGVEEAATALADDVGASTYALGALSKEVTRLWECGGQGEGVGEGGDGDTSCTRALVPSVPHAELQAVACRAGRKLRLLLCPPTPAHMGAEYDPRHYRLPASYTAEAAAVEVARAKKPPPFTLIRRNAYTIKVPRVLAESEECGCAGDAARDKDKGGEVCGEDCVNRLLRVECIGPGREVGGAKANVWSAARPAPCRKSRRGGGDEGAGAREEGRDREGEGEGGGSVMCGPAPLPVGKRKRGVASSSDVAQNRINCGGGPLCGNRPLQLRSEPALRVVETPGKGWGLQAGEVIRAGAFIIEYVGEIISEAEQDARLAAARQRGEFHAYMMEIDQDVIIDARFKSNWARFINHCCEPNAELQRWNVAGYTRIGIFALTDIGMGEEVTYDYQFFTQEKTKCMCGAPACRGYLGANVAADVAEEEAEEAAAKAENKRAKAEREAKRRKKAREAAATAAASSSSAGSEAQGGVKPKRRGPAAAAPRAHVPHVEGECDMDDSATVAGGETEAESEARERTSRFMQGGDREGGGDKGGGDAFTRFLASTRPGVGVAREESGHSSLAEGEGASSTGAQEFDRFLASQQGLTAGQG